VEAQIVQMDVREENVVVKEEQLSTKVQLKVSKATEVYTIAKP
jgi:hypothetical protein